MPNERIHTPAQTRFAVLAIQKFLAGETINPKSCTREHFGDYYPLVNEMRQVFQQAIGAAEVEPDVQKTMEVYWQAVRVNVRYRELVAAVDGREAADVVRDAEAAARDRPIILGADEISAQPMRWIWAPYIPRGMLVMLDGDPGLGKGLMIVQVASNLSREWPFPDQFGKPTLPADVDGPQYTLILSAEDSLEHVMAPRLERAGADRKYIKFMTGWRDSAGEEQAFTLDDLPMLEWALSEVKPVLVVLDPLVAYLGDIDMHRSNQTRPLMAKLKALAERHDCTIMGIRHPAKLDLGGRLMYRGQGNIDIVGAARSALWVQPHPVHPETQTLMIHSKTNVARHGRTVIFSREDGAFAWKGVSRLTESMLTGKGPDPHAFLEAFFWLEEKMTPGHPYESATLDKEAKSREITEGTMKRARKLLGIVAKRIGDMWYSILPPLRITPPTNTSSPTSPTSPTSTPSVIPMGYDADDQGVGVVEEGEEGQEVEVGGVIIRAREGDSADGSDRRAHVRKLWERRGVPEHCPACGGRDWDRTRAGVVICIRCAEKEESA